MGKKLKLYYQRNDSVTMYNVAKTPKVYGFLLENWELIKAASDKMNYGRKQGDPILPGNLPCEAGLFDLVAQELGYKNHGDRITFYFMVGHIPLVTIKRQSVKDGEEVHSDLPSLQEETAK